MDLIKVVNSYPGYTDIVKDGVTHTIRHLLIKRILYSEESSSITFVLDRNRTIELRYYEVEDINNLGNAYTSLNDFWNSIFFSMNSIASNFLFSNGDNFVFNDGSNFTFNTI